MYIKQIPKGLTRKNEIKEKRSLNSKHFKKGNGEFVMNAYVGHIHYFNKLGVGDGEKRFREINEILKWNEKKRGWYFELHNFQPFLPEYADEWIEFRDLFNDKDQTVRYKPVCSHVKGRLVMPIEISLEKQTHANCVIYDNAFAKGIDLILYFTASALKKVVRIREGYKQPNDMSFDFEVEFPKGKKIQRGINKKNIAYKLDLRYSNFFDTDKQTLIGDEQNDGKEWHTYLRGFKVWDSKKEETVKVNYYLKNGKKYLKKIVSYEFLKNSVGDVFTDTTTSYYTGSGDGSVSNLNQATWNEAITDLTGTASNYTEGGVNPLARKDGVNDYLNRRLFYPINTSTIGEEVIISNTILNIYWSGGAKFDDDSVDLDIIEATIGTAESGWTTLSITDYGSINSTVFSSVSQSPLTVGNPQYIVFSFNNSGKNAVNKTGFTRLAMTYNLDVDAIEPTGSNALPNCLFSEFSDPNKRPYLSVTYELPAVSPNLTKRKNYNGYLAFVQQFIKHRLADSTPWAHPDGFLI